MTNWALGIGAGILVLFAFWALISLWGSHQEAPTHEDWREKR